MTLSDEIVGGRAAKGTTNGRCSKLCEILTPGAVTRLSPYIRYGVLRFGEIRDKVMNQVQHQDKLPSSSTNWVGAITGNGCMLS